MPQHLIRHTTAPCTQRMFRMVRMFRNCERLHWRYIIDGTIATATAFAVYVHVCALSSRSRGDRLSLQVLQNAFAAFFLPNGASHPLFNRLWPKHRMRPGPEYSGAFATHSASRFIHSRIVSFEALGSITTGAAASLLRVTKAVAAAAICVYLSGAATGLGTGLATGIGHPWLGGDQGCGGDWQKPAGK